MEKEYDYYFLPLRIDDKEKINLYKDNVLGAGLSLGDRRSLDSLLKVSKSRSLTRSEISEEIKNILKNNSNINFVSVIKIPKSYMFSVNSKDGNSYSPVPFFVVKELPDGNRSNVITKSLIDSLYCGEFENGYIENESYNEKINPVGMYFSKEQIQNIDGDNLSKLKDFCLDKNLPSDKLFEKIYNSEIAKYLQDSVDVHNNNDLVNENFNLKI